MTTPVPSPAASTAAQVQLAQALRSNQAFLRAGMVRDVVTAWRGLFRPQQAAESWPPLRLMLGSLVRDRAATSANLAATYYRQARTAAGLGDIDVTYPAPLTDDLIGGTLDPTGLGAFLRAIGNGQTEARASDNAAVLLSGAASRLALQAGRDTILNTVHADGDAIGWARITGPRPCYWCAMLASRGISYKSRTTASFKAHDHCACMAAPAFSHDEVWLQHGEDIRDQWDEVTSHLSGDEAMNAWRRHWNASSTTDDGTGGP